ncbi:MAG TPA: hypothetical protein VKR53_13665, partial [Puia sp.]|nr:hypothetical protein [Puia sp.]
MKKKKEKGVSFTIEELQKQLEKKSAALEQLNQEIKIEASLERVRAVAMSMKKPEELIDICEILLAELDTLGFRNIRNTEVFIFNDEKEYFLNYDYSNDGLTRIMKVSGKNLIAAGIDRGTLQDGEAFTETGITGIALDEWRTWRLNNGYLPDPRLDAASAVYYYYYYSGPGALGISTFSAIATEQQTTLNRFCRVFDLAYRRYADLALADAQARESEIQEALEKVRARSLAMHSSNELSEVVTIVNQQLRQLGLFMERRSAFILIFEEKKKDYMQWIASPTYDEAFSLETPYLDNRIQNDIWEARENKIDYYSKSYSVQEKNELFRFFFKQPSFNILAEEEKKVILDSEHYEISIAFEKNSSLGLVGLTGNLLSSEEGEIVKKVARVFEQAYIRFLDLQRAEAQTREAQIEAALERVRFHTMAMNNSHDVGVATIAMFSELEKLELKNIRVGIAIFRLNHAAEVWSFMKTEEGETVRTSGTLDMNATLVWQGLYQGWQKQDDFFHYFLAGEEKKAYYKVLSNSPDYSLSGEMPELPDQHFQAYYFPEGAIWTYSLNVHSEEHRQILRKFTAVFSLTFRRYLDLKKAEAQAREAQIEAALERVRGKAMAMHNSEDLLATIQVFYHELVGLSSVPIIRCGVSLLSKENSIADLSSVSKTSEGTLAEARGKLDMEGHPLTKAVYENWLLQKECHYILRGNEIRKYHQYMRGQMAIPDYPDDATQHFYFPMFKEGSFYVVTENELSQADVQTYRRFVSVLSLTYKRYNDLQMAETNAREATIEAALEKVRGKAMAMNNSNDLSSTASLVFTELRKLGINPIRSGVGLFNKETRNVQLYSATSSVDGDSLSLVGWVMMSGHPVLEDIYLSWLNNTDYFPELTGEELKKYYEKLLSGLPIPVHQLGKTQKQYGCFIPVSVGCFNAWSEYAFNEEQVKIFKRFASIIDLTFRRYIELQKSEANARETVKQAALDRVRADIASMRTVSDLERITPLIWKELNILGIPFIRCGVFIMNDEQQLIHTFLSTPDGKAIAAFHIPYDTPGNIKQVIIHWHNHKNYIDHWGEEEFTTFAQTLVRQGALTSPEQYLKTIPHGGFYLHFLPFLQGMLYVGNTNKLAEEDVNLIQSIAKAFSTAYARYEDFNKLEAAKQQVDKTLADLRQAQQQLVQSEKMASLG